MQRFAFALSSHDRLPAPGISDVSFDMAQGRAVRHFHSHGDRAQCRPHHRHRGDGGLLAGYRIWLLPLLFGMADFCVWFSGIVAHRSRRAAIRAKGRSMRSWYFAATIVLLGGTLL